MDSISLYIHLPWCVQKCPYCDFNSHPIHQALPEGGYLKSLLDDLRFEAKRLSGRTIHSIFFGGGTPSLFSAHSIEAILSGLSRDYRLADDIEVTLEANPGTAEGANFRGYHEAGVNRLSLGFQSLDDAMLKRLGRIHSAKEALAAYDMAREAGFENVNLDLMFGLPNQDKDHALGDLTQTIDLGPEHLSWYQLTLEPNTAFAQNPPGLPENDAIADMQESGILLLEQHRFSRYEVSAYAQPGLQCRHNLNYWQFGDYLGIGAGAHSKLQNIRYARHRHPRDYMRTADSPDVYQETRSISGKTLLFEFLLNQLRLTDGFSESSLQDKAGTGLNELRDLLNPAFDNGLLEIQGDTCRCTERGYQFIDEILLQILPETNS